MKLTKMQGAGNDYLYADETRRPSPARSQISALCDRHFGLGADGVIFLGRSDRADLRMSVFNADGSPAEVCGNALRCVARYAVEFRLVPQKELTIESGCGVHRARVEGDRVSVSFPRPRLRFCRQPFSLGGQTWELTGVNAGNPHAVLFCEEPAAIPLEALSRDLRDSPFFPQGVNLEAAAFSPGRLRVRVYERGSGYTLACGSGACACAVAAEALFGAKGSLTVALPGGELVVGLGENELLLSGEAKTVFITEIPDQRFAQG